MMNTRNMKLWFCVACLVSTLAAPAPSQGPQLYLDIIDMAAISRMSPEQLETLAEGLAAEEIMRTKRSSAQSLSSVASKASSGLQSKVGLLGQASGFLGSASSGSGGHGDEHAGYSYEPQHGEKYDYWGLKKSILFTLFQAVKAITGGVTILKGQLIKGGGALAATLGKVISGKGDAVSNLGKKIVSSAALSNKKPSAAPAVYGPPPTAHLEYGPPSAYGAPTAPAHFTAPSAPTGYAAHKYPAQLDGRDKLNGLHAGLVFLTPLGDTAPSEAVHTGHTPLEPPSSILNTVYSAIKGAFSTAPAHVDEPYSYQPPPPPQPMPSFKPMAWGAVDSYGEPASADPYDYYPSDSYPPYDYGAPKHSAPPVAQKKGLTADKIQKINNNLNKVYKAYMNEHQRSSEDYKITGLNAYREMMKKGQLQLYPTPVVSDNEIGVLPAELLPDPFTTTTSTTTSTTTEKPKTTTESDQNRRQDFKYFLRGNKIVQV